MQSREYELWSYRPNLKWGLVLVPEPVAMQQVPAISVLLQVSLLYFYGFTFVVHTGFVFPKPMP